MLPLSFHPPRCLLESIVANCGELTTIAHPHYVPTHSLVCSYVYRESLQDALDPPLITGRFRQSAVATLHALSRVNRLFHAEALPFLYADVSIGLPASFEGFLGTVGVIEDDDDDHGGGDGPLPAAAVAALGDAASDRTGRTSSVPLFEVREGLLTPPASRETSRDRGG